MFLSQKEQIAYTCTWYFQINIAFDLYLAEIDSQTVSCLSYTDTENVATRKSVSLEKAITLYVNSHIDESVKIKYEQTTRKTGSLVNAFYGVSLIIKLKE